jgi:hypothetical protein
MKFFESGIIFATTEPCKVKIYNRNLDNCKKRALLDVLNYPCQKQAKNKQKIDKQIYRYKIIKERDNDVGTVIAPTENKRTKIN